MKQRNGKVLCAAHGCQRIATCRLTMPRRKSGSQPYPVLCLSGACSVRPLSTNRHASVWLYGDDGLQPVLQRHAGRVIVGWFHEW